MKYIFFCLCVFCIWDIKAQRVTPRPISNNFSEMKIIDSGNIRFIYAYNAIDLTEQETYDDLKYLEIGATQSRFYSYFIHRSDSLKIDWLKKNAKAESIKITMGIVGKLNGWSEYQYNDCFKNFAENKFIEYIQMPRLIPCYKYSEEIPVFDWEIMNDTITIINYTCQKAICHFRGRDYTAWFCPDIPISNGPWKFGGLPGLILKLYDKDKLYTYECVGVEQYGNKFPIKTYDEKNYTKIERKKLLNLYKNIHENYRNIVGIKKLSGEPIPRNNIDYKTIELE